MRMKRAIITPVMVALIGLASGGWLLQRGVDPSQNVYAQARLLEEVIRHVSGRFVDETQPDQLYRMAIDGMLDELGDPHSVLMDPEDYEDLRVQTHGEYGGLGIEIDVRDGWLTVLSPLPGSPAEQVGLQAGDRIIRVEGESTKDWTTEKAVSVLRGPKGSTVNITVSRVGIPAPIPFEVTRDEITITAVPAAYMLDGNVGYVELTVFSETATRDLGAAIDGLRQQGARSLILDMRRNTGGLLDEGISVADLFLERGELVLETRGRSREQNQIFRAARPDQYAGMPVAVLIGQRSASATEIVAGALQDHDRALLLGETSFGKGSVQTLYELPGRNILKLTTARWYTPSGRSIQKPYGVGSTPLAAAEDAQEEERAAADAARSEDEKEESDVPVYRTDSGREVLGGGGITPDLVVMDTLSDAEQALVQAIRQDVALFNSLLYRYAVEYAHANPNLRPGFPITEQMMSGFYDLLRREGLEVERDVFDRAELIRSRLADEISTARFSREEGWKRRTANDPQVLAAAELLRGARSPAELFALLPQYAESHGLTLGSESGIELEARQSAHP